jgi:hypothetical protein
MQMNLRKPSLEQKFYEVEEAFYMSSTDLRKELIAIYNDIQRLLPDIYFNITERIDQLILLKLKRCIEFSYKYCLSDQLAFYAEAIRFKEQLISGIGL